MSLKQSPHLILRACAFLGSILIVVVFAVGCGSEISSDPRELLLAPADVSGMQLTVVSQSEEESEQGQSALVELQGTGFRVLQSVVLFADREAALAALDGVRGDLVSRGETGPGGMEASGVLEHSLGQDEASSLFFIEDRALVRLTVTGPERQQHLTELAEVARNKLKGG